MKELENILTINNCEKLYKYEKEEIKLPDDVKTSITDVNSLNLIMQDASQSGNIPLFIYCLAVCIILFKNLAAFKKYVEPAGNILSNVRFV